MVIYGAPNSSEKDTENAVLTAIEMQEKLIELYQQREQNRARDLMPDAQFQTWCAHLHP